MANINLLPWREKLREEKKRQFLIVLGLASAIAASIVLCIHLFFVNTINNQRDVNNILKKEIKLLDKQIKQIKKLKKEKESLLARMSIIEELQTSRPLSVKVFDEVVSIIPDGVYLLTAKRKGSKLDIIGIAESNTLVSKLMRNIDTAQWLKSAKLNEVKNADKSDNESKTFRLSMAIKKVTTSSDSLDDNFPDANDEK